MRLKKAALSFQGKRSRATFSTLWAARSGDRKNVSMSRATAEYLRRAPMEPGSSVTAALYPPFMNFAAISTAPV